SVPEGNKELRDGRVQRVEGFLPGLVLRIEHVAEVRVIDEHALDVEVQRAFVDETQVPQGRVELIACAELKGPALELGELAVTAQEILRVGIREKIAVEVGVRLRVIAHAAIKGPVIPQSLRVADLIRAGADAPGIAEEAIAAIQRR